MAAEPGGLGSGGESWVLMPAWGFCRDARLPVCWRAGAEGVQENSQKECAGISSEAMSVEVAKLESSFFSH